MADKITIHAVGDVSPARDKGEFLLAPTAAFVRQADISFCQLENPFSRKILSNGTRDTPRIRTGSPPVGPINSLAAQRMLKRS